MTGKAIAAVVALAVIGGAGAGVVKIVQEQQIEETVAVMETHTRAPAKRSSAAPTQQTTDKPQAAASPNATEDAAPEPTATPELTATPEPTPTATPRPTPTAMPTSTATPEPVWSEWSTETPPDDAVEVETKEQWRYRHASIGTGSGYTKEDVYLNLENRVKTSRINSGWDTYSYDYYELQEEPHIWTTGRWVYLTTLESDDQRSKYVDWTRSGINNPRIYQFVENEETGKTEVWYHECGWTCKVMFYTHWSEWKESTEQKPEEWQATVVTRTLYRYLR